MFGGGSGWLPASAGSHNSFSIVRHVSFQQEATKGLEQAILNRDLGDEPQSVVQEAAEDDESGSEKSDKTSSSGEDSDSSIEAAINGGENEDELY